MSENQLSPIVVFVYNRPEHTRRTIQALLKNPEAKLSDLFVFSDAAKDKSAEEAVQQVRQYIRQIFGFKTVTIYERDNNWGLANSVIDGVTRICNEFGKVVVLEDDLQVSPHFLAYMNAGLDKYEHDEQVMQIAGYMFPVKLNLEEDALFLPFTSSWGWATWQRAWKYFDHKATGYATLTDSADLRKEFDLYGRYPYFKMLEAQKNAKVDSWAILWYLSVFNKKGLVLYPKKSLVENTGFDGSGVNCVASGFEKTHINFEVKINRYPDNVELSEMYQAFLEQMHKPRLRFKSVVRRYLNLLKKWFCFK